MAPAEIPVPSSIVVDSVFQIWDGETWNVASAYKIIEAEVTTTGPATLNIRATSCDDEHVLLEPNTPVGGITIGWEAA